MLQEITIQFTEQCNVECSYCFAPKKEMGVLSQSDFNSIFDFCCKEQIDVIHITGGEPSLNSNFSQFVSKLSEISSLVIYSNFTTKNEVNEIKCSNPSEIVFLVNITSQKFCTKEELYNMYENIDYALKQGFRVALSYTFFDPLISIEEQFDYLLNKMKRYGLRNLRISQALSFNDEIPFLNQKKIKELYHFVATHINEWIKTGLSVYFDCPIPPCYVDKSDYAILRQNNAVSLKCIPKVFIMYNLKVTHCYSTMDFYDERYLTSFTDLISAKKYTTQILNSAYNKSKRTGCNKCIYSSEGIPCGCPSYYV